MMEFDRVRNDEQRKIRVQQIKNAAIKLFDNEPFHEIDLTKIANETSFTRGNLYKYISSKEEIYLLVVLDEINDWVSDLRNTFNADMTHAVTDFSQQWTQVVYRHQRFLKLISLLFTTIEQKVSLESLVNFKKQLSIELFELSKVVKTVFPTWDDHHTNKFLRLQMYHAIGLFSATSPSQLQQEAIEQAGVSFPLPAFVDDFSEFISYTVHYLNSSLAQDQS
ncbi:TetR/AcrR family transcriptional regulator [Paenibacillus medicaginis]|uniref:TetR/AcrR family transcriptional regulator n=1 Tax=Paenibacillus medicaginis TaxID=1470560 RepID=A0ABV5BWB2_9BACL